MWLVVVRKIDRSRADAGDAYVKRYVSVGPKTELASRSAVVDVPRHRAFCATKIAYQEQKPQRSTEKSNNDCLAMQLRPMVERMDRSSCHLAQENGARSCPAASAPYQTFGLAMLNPKSGRH